MPANKEKYQSILQELGSDTTLVAVSKTKPAADILELYQLGQKDFGENYVQELQEKEAALPKDIHWHFIGHLQSNKVKYIAPFVYLIHGVDSFKLLQEINKQAAKLNKTIDVLLQVHIAKEETKFGLDEKELDEIFAASNNQLAGLNNICIKGLMGMASFTEDKATVVNEFRSLKSLYDKYAQIQIPNSQFQYLSMGMSGDYNMAIANGSNMVRIGSLLFGERNYNKI
ncbi:MAG: YggS family pyridoxal phosphate-dependent enzyme [Chitinophagaceae bacterium]